MSVRDAAQISALGFRLAASPDWQSFIRYFELGEGFAFVVLLVTNEAGAEQCRDALNEFLRESGKKLQTVSIADESGLAGLAATLLELPVAGDIGAVWVSKVVPETSQGFAEWAKAWRSAVARLNQFRNPFRRHFQTPVIFVGAPWLQQVLRENAPDLWSVRTFVARIDTDSRVQQAGRRAPIVTGPDPELAMAEAGRLQKHGKLVAAARLLHRAALGYKARNEFEKAANQLKASIDLGESANAGIDEQAEKKSELGAILERLSNSDPR